MGSLSKEPNPHLPRMRLCTSSAAFLHPIALIELLFVFVDTVFVAPRSDELGIAA